MKEYSLTTNHDMVLIFLSTALPGHSWRTDAIAARLAFRDTRMVSGSSLELSTSYFVGQEELGYTINTGRKER